MAIVVDAGGFLGTVSAGSCSSSSRPITSAFLSNPSSRRLQSSWRKTASLKSAQKRRFSAACIVSETKEVSTGVVDDASFKTLVLESDLPVLVDFWAPWCGPCRMLDPVIDNVAEKYKGRIKCYKVNTDECSKTATELGIRSIPTCMIFNQGERLDTVIGCVPETTLTNVIDKYIAK